MSTEYDDDEAPALEMAAQADLDKEAALASATEFELKELLQLKRNELLRNCTKEELEAELAKRGL